ncbi:MAG: hypothetical protein QI197_04545 [Candidatus Korarchaeota archaeon]|nr:hypothetical protein [Candidatus Korarchaeota archaeon]
MSLILGGSLSTIVFGGLAALSAASNAVKSRVIVQPEVIRALSSSGAPWLIAKTYDDLIMDEASLTTFYVDRKLPPYHEHGLVRGIELNESMEMLSSRLMEEGATHEEARIISLAVGSFHDRLILLRRNARDLARRVGLHPSSPLVALTEALNRNVIRLDDYMSILTNLFRMGRGVI